MRRLLTSTIGLGCLLVACTRAPDGSRAGPPGGAGTAVSDDMKDVAKATEKAAKDIGHATADLADKAGDRLGDLTHKAGAGGEDAWITTKVKSELTRNGLDPLHVHVDTDAQVVTLSGTVDSTTEQQKAVAAAKGVTGVAEVKDHLFVRPAQR
jgi:osmotically-inducible protein OsmY